jgi:hypothetical protein
MNNNDFEKLAGQLARSAVTGETLPSNLMQIKTAFVGGDAGRYLLGGLGGAGIGALIGATQGRNKKRNALYYGTLGGLGGLGLAHFMNGGNSAAPTPSTTPTAKITPSAAPAAVKPKDVQRVETTPMRVADKPTEQVALTTNADGTVSVVPYKGYRPDAIKPHMETDLYKQGPSRHPLADGVSPNAGGSDFLNWVQTGKMPWYKKLTGRTTQYQDRFRGLLESYERKTGKPATSMAELRETGLLPKDDLDIYTKTPSGQPIAMTNPQDKTNLLQMINRIREFPGGEEFYLNNDRDMAKTIAWIQNTAAEQARQQASRFGYAGSRGAVNAR